MKFLYEYRTPDNVLHKGVVTAPHRDAAYAELKKLGIKPSRLSEAPGFFNMLFGKGKRWMAIAVLAALCVTLAVIIRSTPTPSTYTSLDASLDSSVRRQVIGDAAIIDEGVRTGWASFFELEGDRFLASFAIPGTEPAVRSTTEEKLREALRCSPSPSTFDSDGLEARQIRAIVAGMKEELREFLAAGGTIPGYGRELVRRQEEELGYYNRALNEYERARETMGEGELRAFWREQNEKLRRLGIRLIPLSAPSPR